MCGIVGIAGKIGKEQREIFDQMLIADSLRGPHSTGLVTAKGVDTHVFKMAGDPYFVRENKGYDRALIKPSNVLIGHNRYATVGAVNRANAHPFDFPTVVGVHNGTLTNKYDMPNSHMFDVDSEALYNAIDTLGIDAAIGKARGAWSLVWWDKVDKTLNFLRNKERPMCYCFSEDNKTLYFASEGNMLQWILLRNGIKFQQIRSTAENVLFSLDIQDKFEGAAVPFEQPKTREVLGAAPIVFQNGYLANNGTNGVARNNVSQLNSLANFLNTTVSFICDTTLKDPSTGETYVLGELSGRHQTTEVLVDVHSNPNKVDELLSDDDETAFLTYKGIVRSIRNINGKQYLMVGIATVMGEIPLKKSGAPFNSTGFVGFGGVPIQAVHWRDLTAQGCVYCGHIPVPQEQDTLEWITQKIFSCNHCRG